MDRAGKPCPEKSARLRTAEGHAVWDFGQRVTSWIGGGFGSPRLDREELRRRTAGRGLAEWAVAELADHFEAEAKVAMTPPKDAGADHGE